MATYPPRPNAIATILENKDDVKNIQILLYSIIKKSRTTKSTSTNAKETSSSSTHVYAPELLILTTNECNDVIKENKLDVFCDRIIVVENVTMPLKLGLFKLVEYERILYVDCSHVVAKDVSSVFESLLDSNNTIAGVPKSDSGFSTNVLLIKPCISTYQSLCSYDSIRDSNIMVTDKEDERFDHYFASSFSPLSKEATTSAIHSEPSKSLKIQYYTKCETYKESILQKRKIWKEKYEEKKRKASLNYQNAKASATAAAKSSASSKQSREIKEKHVNVSQRYKQLRKEGLNVKDAMLQARKDCGDDSVHSDANKDSGKQVAKMFGLSL